MTDARPGPDGRLRCPWSLATPDYLEYHDSEWGRPVTSIQGLYERMTLEAFQSGLSWLTILRKREAFRRAFDGFRPEQVATYGPEQRERLMSDAGIVRNSAKIDAAINNAGIVASLGDHFAEMVWTYSSAARPRPVLLADVPASTPESIMLSRQLKRLGIRFVGPTTAYAMMQAVGVVDDHLADCETAP